RRIDAMLHVLQHALDGDGELVAGKRALAAEGLIRIAGKDPVGGELVHGVIGPVALGDVREHSLRVGRPAEAQGRGDAYQKRQFLHVSSSLTFWFEWFSAREVGPAPTARPRMRGLVSSARDTRHAAAFRSLSYHRAAPCGVSRSFHLLPDPRMARSVI